MRVGGAVPTGLALLLQPSQRLRAELTNVAPWGLCPVHGYYSEYFAVVVSVSKTVTSFTRTRPLVFVVRCVFDSSASSPASLIIGQQFVVVESGKPLLPSQIVPTQIVLSEPITQCGFSAQTITLVTVQLTITTNDGRSATTTNKVTFTKNGVC